MTDKQAEIEIAAATLPGQRLPAGTHTPIDLAGADCLGTTRRGPVGLLPRPRLATHRDLAAALADLAGAEHAVVTPVSRGADQALLARLKQQGYLTAIAQPDVDAGFRQAASTAGIRLEVLATKDPTALDDELMRHTYGRSIVRLSAVSLVDGRLADLRPLQDVISRHRALLLVEETHSLACVGDGGRGLVHAAGWAGRPDVLVTARLDGLGSVGTALLGSADLLAPLTSAWDAHERSPAWVERTQAALDWLRHDPSIPGRVLERARALGAVAHAARWLAAVPQGPFVPLVFSSALRRAAAVEALRQHGVLCALAPAVLAPDCLHRIVLMSRVDLTDDELDAVGVAMSRARAELG